MRNVIVWSILIGVGFWSAWWYQEAHWQRVVNNIKEAHQQEKDERATELEKALNDSNALRQEAENTISKQRTENLEHGKAQQAEIDRLNFCLRTGKCGLRIAATCPSSGGMQPAGNAIGDIAGAARLTAAAEQDYLTLRRALIEQYATLQMCRAYAKALK